MKDGLRWVRRKLLSWVWVWIVLVVGKRERVGRVARESSGGGSGGTRAVGEVGFSGAGENRGVLRAGLETGSFLNAIYHLHLPVP